MPTGSYVARARAFRTSWPLNRRLAVKDKRRRIMSPMPRGSITARVTSSGRRTTAGAPSNWSRAWRAQCCAWSRVYAGLRTCMLPGPKCTPTSMPRLAARGRVRDRRRTLSCTTQRGSRSREGYQGPARAGLAAGNARKTRVGEFRSSAEAGCRRSGHALGPPIRQSRSSATLAAGLR
jgi:hypothetical protein